MLTKIFGSPHFFAFISCLLFCLAHTQTGTEICNSVGQLSATMSPLAINTPLSVTQGEDECVRFFQLTMSTTNYQANKYLILEVTFDNLSSNLSHRPYLLEKTASASTSPSAAAPQIKFTSTSTYVDASLMDNDGFMNRKTYHNIVIEPANLPTNGVLYFAMYKYFDQDNDYVKFSVQYTVNVRYSTTYPCPQDCSNHGTCDATAKQCVCNTNYFDLDCSVKATELKVGKTLNQTISPLAYNYFYVELDSDPSNDLILTTKKSGGSLELQLLFTTPTNYSIPNFFDNDGYATITLSNVNQPATIEGKSLKTYTSAGKTVMMLGVYNYADSTNTQVILKLSNGDSSDSSDDTEDEATRNAIMYAMIGIASVLVILWSIFSVIKYKIYREAEALRRQHQEAAAQQHRETTYLTREELDKYFPKTNFANIQSSFAQNMCSICLDDFEKGTVCRQLTCEHVFNDTCIEAWLANHDSCPNCKKEMTVSAIETFLKAKKTRKSGLNKLHSINEHDDKHNHTEAQFLGLNVGPPPVNANTARGAYRQSEILDNSHTHINLNESRNFPIYRDIGQMHENPDMVVDISDGREDLQSRGRVRRVHPAVQRIQPRLHG